MHLPEEEQGALLTLQIEQKTIAPALQETIMADDNDTRTDADTPAAVVPNVPKKERKPRAKKAAPETVAPQLVSALIIAAGKQKRGRKRKSVEGAINAKHIPVKRGPKTVKLSTAPSTAAIDQISDLLQLEEENQRLRKLLAEKLRAENADLRKRLSLG
jgi:hypothetical protein